MLSSYKETWEGEQRNKSSVYPNKVEPAEKFASSKSTFTVHEKW